MGHGHDRQTYGHAWTVMDMHGHGVDMWTWTHVCPIIAKVREAMGVLPSDPWQCIQDTAISLEQP